MDGKTASPEYVGFWSRVLATTIDLILSSLLVAPLVNAFYGSSTSGDLGALSGSPDDVLSWASGAFAIKGPADFLISFVLPAAATIAFWVARQATPGKMVIHARIVDAVTLEKPSPGKLLVRYLGYYVCFFSLCLGFAWVGWDPRKQGWHDKMAGTVVIRDKKQ
jgi:uncharacterized RDD family membrane protein YckC